jgi:molybdate transport system substrate-binding protein
MKARLGRLVLVAALAGAACGSSGNPVSGSPGALSGTINVFAASSLTDSFRAMGHAFQQAHGGVTVQYSFAGTPTLVTQVEQGAPADVFASADSTNMDKLKADGFTAGTPQVFAHNVLEIVVGPGNPKGITGLSDLARAGVIYISEASTVPAGKYSLLALQKAGVTVKPRSLETDVKSVISKIELGEADAGIVYTTDVRAAGNRVQGVPIPDRDNVVAAYPIVTVKGTRQSRAAGAFIAFVLSSEGQSILASLGFRSATA